MSILSPFFYWPEYGSMFTAPAVDATVGLRTDSKGNGKDDDVTTAGSNTPAGATTVVPKVRCELCFQRVGAAEL